jgi:hypothetical protein
MTALERCAMSMEQMPRVALTLRIERRRVMSIRAPVFLLAAGAAMALSAAFAQTPASQPLKSPSDFQSIASPADRSRAIFAEVGKVLTHPRCMNCHPAGEHPLQGADGHEHRPRVWRNDTGNFGTPCGECHTQQNVTLREAASYSSIPGHPRWAVAPLEMAWQGKSIGDICRQLKDTARNGGRDLALLHEHIARDDLVAWGWTPGAGREPAPGSQELAGQLVQAWIDSGAECPG